jgi:NTP pyrophosphatase (non-canonical NTP hydrolase)
MNFKEYQKAASQTALYPQDKGLYYTALGLVDELGELAEKLYVIVDDQPHRYSTNDKTDIMKETGDVLWYVAMLAKELDIDLEFPVSSIMRPEVHLGYDVVGEALVVACKVAGRVKKIIRDGSDATKVDAIRMYLEAILNKLSKATHHLGLFSLETVAGYNIYKLTDRSVRGVLQGDGDTR